MNKDHLFSRLIIFSVTFFLSLVLFVAEGKCFLKAEGQSIVDANGDTVLLRGIGLGGWLVPEGYQLHIPGFGSPSSIRKLIVNLIGEDNAEEFYLRYLENYVTEADIDSIASWGFNSIRIPFNYRLLSPEDQPNVFLEEGFAYLDTLMIWCEKNHLYLILDMHCAPGGQNSGNISDSDGIEARLWTEPENQDRTVEIWKKIAERYVQEEWIGGYDLINEPVLPSGYSNTKLRAFYMRLAQEIRKIDTNHILFIEGNWYATDFTFLDPPFDTNMVYSFHKYWSENSQGAIQSYVNLRSRYKIPLWMGESGENSNTWFFDAVRLFEENKIGWCWWMHKKIETMTSPYSSPITPDYQRVLDYWNGQASKPSVDYAKNALLSIAENLKSENCDFRPGVLKALLGKDFGTQSTPFAENNIPGTIPCVNYDFGREGVAYHDVDFQNISGPGGSAWNRGYTYRNDGVDIEKSENGAGTDYNVGWTETGEWIKYSVNVQQPGSYAVSFRLASPYSTGKLQLLADDETLISFFEIPNTGGWQSWQTITADTVSLNAGSQHLIFKVLNNGFNISQMIFELIASSNGNRLDRPVPEQFQLEQNYPNPFNASTFIEFALPDMADVDISIYNIQGQLVRKLVEERKTEGWYQVAWQPFLNNESNFLFASGVYFYQLKAQAGKNRFSQTKQMILLQ